MCYICNNEKYVITYRKEKTHVDNEEFFEKLKPWSKKEARDFSVNIYRRLVQR